MDHTHPRTRKLMTYGSSKPAQIHSQTSSAHGSSTKRRIDSPSRPQRSKSSSRASIRGKNEANEPSDSTSTTTTTTTHGPRATMNDSIYDLPASDEEEKSSIMRRKRRRNGSNGIAASRRTHTDLCDSQRMGAISDLTNVSNSRTATSKAKPGTPSPSTRKTARSHRMSSNLNSDSRTQSSAQGITKSPLLHEPQRSLAVQDSRSPSREVEPTWHIETSTSPVSPNSRSSKIVAVGQITPSRRRLIDSLAMKEGLIDGSWGATLFDGPSPPPFVSCRSNRPHESNSPSMIDDSQQDGSGKDSVVPNSPHLKGSKVTYGRQRSFLDDLSIASGLVHQDHQPGGGQVDSLISPQREPRYLETARPSVLEEVHDADGPVRSIHELRQAGGNARYRGAVDSIFEDIEDLHNTVSGRCNAFVQLCGKLLDSKLARQFVECGFDKRLVDCLSNDFDVVSAALALSAFGLSFNGRPLPYLLATAAWPRLLDMSLTLLSAQDDILTIAHARGSAFSKPVQRAVRDVRSRILSTLFGDTSLSKLSPCILALRCLKLTIAAFQEKDETPSGLPTPVLKQLIDLLLSELPQSDGCTVLPPNQSIVLGHGLSILEAHTISGTTLHQDQSGILSLLSNMHGLLQWKKNPDATNQHVQALFIRVVLNVTNIDSKLCDDFGTGSMVGQLAEIALANFGEMTEESLAKENNSLDTVILALGTLVNLTEQSEATRAMFLHSHSKTQSLLDRLLHFFSAHVGSTSKAHSVLEVHHNVAVGYLAVLLLALCLDADVRKQVKLSMSTDGLTVVMSTVEEFLQYHRKIEQELYPLRVQGGGSGFVLRLQSLLDQIQRIESD